MMMMMMMMKRRCIGFVVVAMLAATAPALADEKEDEARTHFSAGVNLLKDPARPRYEEAYVEFKKAYALAASPKILGNLGLCAMKLERDAEAIEAFTKYLAEVPDLDAGERAQVERDLTTLKATVATITIETKPSGATMIDKRTPVQGDPITNSYGPINGSTSLSVRKGHHIFIARFEGTKEVSWETDVLGGEKHVFELPSNQTAEPNHTVDSTVESPFPRPIPTSVYIAGGLTAAFAVGWGVTGILALDTRSRFDEANDGSNPNRAEDLRSTGKTLNVVSDAMLIGTILMAAATTYLFVTRPSLPSRGPRSAFVGLNQFRF